MFYEDNPTLMCQPCHSSCATCIDSISCSTCPAGSSVNSTSQLCVLNPCTDVNCLVCNTTNCITCNTGYSPSGDLCVTRCGDNITIGS